MATKFLDANGVPQKCKKCEKAFEIGDWACSHGGDHEVNPKTYYVDCTVNDPNDMKKAQQTVNVTEGRKWRDAMGQEQEEIRQFITFRRGSYATTNPKEQWGLETINKAALISEEHWKERFFTPTEKHNLREANLKAREARVNELLNEVQAKHA